LEVVRGCGVQKVWGGEGRSTTDLTELSEHSIVVVAKDKISADLSDEAVILDLKSGVYYGLDAVGARIWALIQEPRAVDAIRDTILSEYEVEPERCERELFAFLQELAAQGLIEVADVAGV
jgi:hypothetical protein